MNRPGAEPEVHRITGARRSHTEDLDRRINRYLFSMAVRTACVVLAVVVNGPLRWVFAVFAVFLPYVAVVLANATDRRSGTGAPQPVHHRGLAAGEGAVPAAERPVVLEGQLVSGPSSPPAPPAAPPPAPPAAPAAAPPAAPAAPSAPPSAAPRTPPAEPPPVPGEGPGHDR